MKIHFICKGNVYRSRLAEAYLLSLNTDFEVFSSGSAADYYREENMNIPEYVDKFLQKHGVHVTLKQYPDQLTQERLDQGDVTVCMNQIVYDECSQIFTMPGQTKIWDITDYSEQDGADTKALDDYTEQMYKKITGEVDELLRTLLATSDSE